MSGFLFVESFEGYLFGGGEPLADYLGRIGLGSTGNPAGAQDRSRYGIAAKLDGGDLTFGAESSEPVLSFGFAALRTGNGSWRLTDDLVLTLGEEPRLNGITDGTEIRRDQWFYYEVEIDKPRQRAAWFINGQQIGVAVLPGSLRFVTDLSVEIRGDLTVDDLYIKTGEAAGPISIEPLNLSGGDPLPAELEEAGDETGGGVSGAREGDILAVSVKAEVSASDIDNRRVAAYANDATRRLPLAIKPQIGRALFDEAADGEPWTPTNMNAADIGVRITD